MRAGFDHAPMVEHQNLIGIDNGRKPVRDHQGGAVFRNLLQFGLNRFLGFGVERRSRLIEDKDVRIFENRARDGDALLLAAGKL